MVTVVGLGEVTVNTIIVIFISRVLFLSGGLSQVTQPGCDVNLLHSLSFEILTVALAMPQLLLRRVEVHCLQCKNCQYRFLGHYPL